MIQLLLVLLVVGFVVYFVNTALPIDAKFKIVINFIVSMCLLVFVLNFFGITDFDFGRYRRH